MAELSDIFNGGYSVGKLNDALLQVYNGTFCYYYDFKLRLVTSGQGAMLPFAQVDRDVLMAARDKLVELGGKPPELPPEAPAPIAQPRKFNL